MLTVSVLCLTLVFTSVIAHAEKTTDESIKIAKILDKGVENDEMVSDSQGQNSPPANDFDSISDYHLFSQLEQKRGRQFGFVGSRGRRVETPAEAMFGSEFPVRQPTGGSARLRMLLKGHHQGLIAKEKRKPHFGFHGARG